MGGIQAVYVQTPGSTWAEAGPAGPLCLGRWQCEEQNLASSCSTSQLHSVALGRVMPQHRQRHQCDFTQVDLKNFTAEHKQH